MKPARRPSIAAWRTAGVYGLLLAAGTLALQWLDYRRFTMLRSGDLTLALVAAAFLAIGVAAGMWMLRPPRRVFEGNPQAVASLGISPRELAVLHELAAGRSNKEIGAALHVSPNTVKTHVARLYEKLGASRRTDAIARARELGILP